MPILLKTLMKMKVTRGMAIFETLFIKEKAEKYEEEKYERTVGIVFFDKIVDIPISIIGV